VGGLRVAVTVLAILPLAGIAAAAPPTLPNGWPAGLHLGIADPSGGAAALRATSALGFRYHYLSGGLGNGWTRWGNGQFVRDYVRESVLHGFIPVFSYYMLLQSGAGGGSEGDVVAANLQDTGLMADYFRDLRHVFEQAAAFPGSPIVLHVEPDLWGYLQQRGSDDGAGIPAKVGATGLAELAGLPDTLGGFARALGVLRDRYAPNVLLAYHLSVWGTRADFAAANASDADVDHLATRAAAFFRSIDGPFDLVFGEFSDRDAAFKELVDPRDGGASWWDAEDFRRHVRFLATFVGVAARRVVLWQIPLGNTRMRAMDNTWNHYQDNRVEWLLDDPGRGHLQAYVAAGVAGFLFGRGAGGATCACDASGDGVTDPPPINGNTRPSLSADDDGGFFRDRVAAYYAAGALALAPGPGPPPSAPRRARFDWDGDGRADVAVFGPAAGEWRHLPSGGGGAATVRWGNAAYGDTLVPADYDGDGRTDRAVFRRPTGEWFILRTSDGGPGYVVWGAGALGDVAVPADYDGDGRADVAVFRPGTGEWFILRTSDGGLIHVWWGSGPAGDDPVPADYDGDGRADLAVFRRQTGEWFVLRTSDGGVRRVPFGSAVFGDTPVPADYFGVGGVQVAVYRTTTGQWFLSDPAGGALTVGWGVPDLGERPAR
jgi:hypothetical protein